MIIANIKLRITKTEWTLKSHIYKRQKKRKLFH